LNFVNYDTILKIIGVTIMGKFLELEGGYLVIALVILLVTLFVGSRPMFKKGSALKGLLVVSAVLALFIGLHHKVTTDRMAEVKEAFSKGKVIICESRMQRKVAQSIDVDKSREWVLEGDLFTSPNYSRPFHTARCLVK
jgi:predicted membrane chloride channel (bestrophin family)